MSDTVIKHPASTAADKPAVVAAQTGRKFKFDERYIAPVFISLILLAGHFTFGVLESPKYTLTAILTSILLEVVLGRIYTGKTPHLASAYISGISVGILVRSPEIWPYALCAAISVTSKYVIRWHGRHLWNPSNLGICVMLLVAHDSIATLSIQWGNNLYAMLVIWTLGSIIVMRLRRFHICATYVACFFAFALLRAGVAPSGGAFGNRFLAEIAPITGPMYQLFIFFMITDPKTTVKSKQGQMLVAFLVALAENIIRMGGDFNIPGLVWLAPHAPYYALTLMGPTANILEIWKAQKAKTMQPTAPSAVPA